jgi:hypothetical protein
MAWPQRRMAVPTTRTQAHPFNDCPEVYMSNCEREPHREQETQGKFEHEKFCRKGWSAIFSLRERAHADEEEEEEPS